MALLAGDLSPEAHHPRGACAMPPEPTWLPLTRPQAPRLAQAVPVHHRCVSPSAHPPWTSPNVPLLSTFTAGLIPLRLPPLVLFTPVRSVQNALCRITWGFASCHLFFFFLSSTHSWRNLTSCFSSIFATMMLSSPGRGRTCHFVGKCVHIWFYLETVHEGGGQVTVVGRHPEH